VYNIYRVAFSHNGKTAVAAGSGDYAIHLLDASSGTDNASLTGHKGDITALAFSPDGKSLLSGDAVGSLRLWDVAGSTVTTTIEGQFGHDYQASALSPDSSLIAVSYYGDDLIRLWKTDGSGTVLVVLKGHSEGVYSLAFSADGTLLASGSGDYSIIVWDVSTGKTKTIIKNLPSTPYALSFNSDGSLIAAGSSGGIVTLLDAGTGDTVTTFTGHTSAIRSIKFSTDDKKIISVSDDGTIRLWDVSAK
jgi:WD40 repeat protein